MSQPDCESMGEVIGRIHAMAGVAIEHEYFVRMGSGIEYSLETLGGCDHSFELIMKYLERQYDINQAQCIAIRQVLIDAGIRCDCGFVAWLKKGNIRNHI
ncbi:MAG: hypothetical protein ACOY3Z_03395 [Thermodesulfobacteriota bacterium]